jgi:hypothetical protein
MYHVHIEKKIWLHYFLNYFVNDNLAVFSYNTNAELRSTITDAFKTLTSESKKDFTRRRIKLCTDNKGAHSFLLESQNAGTII